MKYQRVLKDSVLYIEDTSYLYQNLNCNENIKYYMTAGSFDENIFWKMLQELEFDSNYLEKRVRELSLGTKQKLSLAFAFSSMRKFIVLDEPYVLG